MALIRPTLYFRHLLAYVLFGLFQGLLLGCGVKAPPLPPLPSTPQKSDVGADVQPPSPTPTPTPQSTR